MKEFGRVKKKKGIEKENKKKMRCRKKKWNKYKNNEVKRVKNDYKQNNIYIGNRQRRCF
jgi:hypothetical protein